MPLSFQTEILFRLLSTEKKETHDFESKNFEVSYSNLYYDILGLIVFPNTNTYIVTIYQNSYLFFFGQEPGPS